MNGYAACSITSETTGIFCVITIYFEKSDGAAPQRRWKRIFGSLFEKCALPGGIQYGNCGHWTNGGEKLALVGAVPGFAMPYVPVSPVFTPDYREPLTVAELFAVPADFLDSMTPEKTIGGEGKLILTQEKLAWSMWFATA